MKVKKTTETFANFEKLKQHLISTDYFSWINDNEPERDLPNFEDVESIEDINYILKQFDYSWWKLSLEY